MSKLIARQYTTVYLEDGNADVLHGVFVGLNVAVRGHLLANVAHGPGLVGLHEHGGIRVLHTATLAVTRGMAAKKRTPV